MTEIIKSPSLPGTSENNLAIHSFWWVFDSHIKSHFRIEKITEGRVYLEYRRSGCEWCSYGNYTFDELKKKAIFLSVTEEGAKAKLDEFALLLESGKGLELIVSFQESEEPGMELMQNKDRILAVEKRAMEIVEKSRAIQQQMKVAMEIKKEQMDQIMRLAQAEISKAFKLVAKVQKIIRSLELYSGVKEDLITIREGVSAPSATPFSVRQAVIFMDEEVGQWREGGFDYSNVEDFDNWLQEPKNLQRVAPEEKCMVAFRPRRNDKDYADKPIGDPRTVWNKQTYFLFRNGENLYRVFTENLQLGTKVFLSLQDMESIADKGISDDDKDLFTRQALFIQGLIDRGEILAPVPEGVNIFKPDTYQGWLHLIYDADQVLTDGRLSWKEWVEEVNKDLKVGSRVIIADGWLGRRSYKEGSYLMNMHSKRYYYSDYNCPSPPYSGGMFQAEAGFDKGQYTWDLSFRYSPGGETWSWTKGTSERKNKITFGFNPGQCVLNYDNISLGDVEYYLNDRAQRQNYLDMLPLLEKIRLERLKEIDHERDFVRLVTDRVHLENPRTGRREIEEEVWRSVRWWCVDKLKWKRPIRKDDTLALRMIEKRIQKIYYNYEPTT